MKEHFKYLFPDNILKNNYNVNLKKLQILYENDKINMIKDKFGNLIYKQNPTIFKTSSLIAGTILSPIIFKGMVGLIGFNSIGILKGSLASKIMASYGGFVTKGSICAILQSIGSSGLGITSIVTASSAGYLTMIISQNNTLSKFYNNKALNSN
ncbi:unnamed protein product [Cunninghamella echinulata]